MANSILSASYPSQCALALPVERRLDEATGRPSLKSGDGMTVEGQAGQERDPGLCRDCQHSRRIESDRGSVFFRCELWLQDPGFPKYPRLPVRVCSGYQQVDGTHS